MFKEVLRTVVTHTEGGVAALLMGFDGIPVEQYVEENAGIDVETIGMEFSIILGQIRKASELLDAGVAKEVSIQAEHMQTVMRLLNDEYFVAVALKPEGNVGKARFLLRTQMDKLLNNLV